MESKTKYESYYDALLINPKRANKILNEILEEDEKNVEKNKELKKNENAKI